MTRARFEESDSEQYLRRRGLLKARKEAVNRYSDERRRLAYMAGYRAATDNGEGRIIAALAVMLLLVALFF